MGRPSEYTEETANQFCELIAEGRSLRSICEQGNFPSRQTILNWLDREDFLAKYARARVMQAEVMDSRILDAADECDEENYQSTRVKIAAYQWRASKLAPKKYGDKLDLNHGGEVAIKRVVTDL